MGPSDFLTILGIALGVWAFVPKKERSLFLAFFSNWELIFFLITLLFIHYLMSFDWVKENWMPRLSVFTMRRGIPAVVWAYIVALLLIAYPISKVSFSFFARAKSKKLLSYYNSLLIENEIDLLVSYIQKYHVRDIREYLKGRSHLPEEEQFDYFRQKKSKAKRKHDKLIKPKRMFYAALVYWNILNNETFVKAAATKYPDLFAKAFLGMETKRGANRDLVQLYIQSLFEENSQSLTEELKIAANAYDSILDRSKNIDLPILSGLFIHTQAAFENYVWYPVGEGAVRAIKFDERQKEFLIKAYDSDLEDELWKYKIWVAIIYFEYMVRETIYRYNGWHMWLHYFNNTTVLIIENIPADEEDDQRIPVYSFNHHVIKKQFEVMFDWLELAVEENKESQVIDTIVCLGKCIDTVCRTPGSKISSKFKIDLVDSLISICFKNIGRADNAASVLIVEWLSKLFLNPANVRNNGLGEVGRGYRAVLKTAWEKFDKIPYEYHEQDAIQAFENDILSPLGLLDTED